MGATTTFCISWMLCVGTISGIRTQHELQLQYYHLPAAAFNPQVLGHIALQPSLDKPPDDCLPEAKGSPCSYFKWSTPRVESGIVWIALQQQDNRGSLDRLYVDTNCDGSLHDEIPTVAFHQQAKSGRRYDLFAPVELRFPGSEEANQYHLSVASVSSEDKTVLVISPAGMFQGTTTTAGGRSTTVVIRDFTVNAFYNDTSEDPAQSDRIVMAMRDGHQHDFHTGMYVEIDQVYYQLVVSSDGSRLKLVPSVDMVLGRLAAPKDVVQLAVGGAKGFFVLQPQDGITHMPIGTYHLDHYTIERQDTDNNLWAISADCSGQDFEISADRTTKLELEGPVTSHLDVWQEDNVKYVFQQRLRGPRGELVAMTHNGMPVDIDLHIHNENETYRQTYRLEYG